MQAKAADAKYEKAFAKLKTELDALAAEKIDVSDQLSQLQEKLSELEKSRPGIPEKTFYAHSGMFAGKPCQPAKDSRKWEILGQIMDDNIKLRAETEIRATRVYNEGETLNDHFSHRD